MGLVSRSIKVGDAISNLCSCDVGCGNMRSGSQMSRPTQSASSPKVLVVYSDCPFVSVSQKIFTNSDRSY
ncbi:hypothetical protein [Pseudanabaena minima]|uniref:hypothetical protein n=1 Tax=Pseudanabaena minima TaxID=890415 RepID=UPI003DA7EC9C